MILLRISFGSLSMWEVLLLLFLLFKFVDENTIGFTRRPTIHFKFITKCNKCYYKMRQLILLQSAMVCYYKVRQVLQNATILLQSAKEQTASF